MKAKVVNPLNAELNPIRHLLPLAGGHHFVDVRRIRGNVFSAKKNSVIVTDVFGSMVTYVLKREFMNADLIVNVYFQKYHKGEFKI
jgi:hypothetical protein